MLLFTCDGAFCSQNNLLETKMLRPISSVQMGLSSSYEHSTIFNITGISISSKLPDLMAISWIHVQKMATTNRLEIDVIFQLLLCITIKTSQTRFLSPKFSFLHLLIIARSGHWHDWLNECNCGHCTVHIL